jgi:hypothetical protein
VLLLKCFCAGGRAPYAASDAQDNVTSISHVPSLCACRARGLRLACSEGLHLAWRAWPALARGLHLACIHLEQHQPARPPSILYLAVRVAKHTAVLLAASIRREPRNIPQDPHLHLIDTSLTPHLRLTPGPGPRLLRRGRLISAGAAQLCAPREANAGRGPGSDQLKGALVESPLG